MAGLVWSRAITRGSQEDRLKHAAFGDRVRKLVDRFFTELDAGLIWIRSDPGDLDLANAAAVRSVARLRTLRVAQERGQTHAEALAGPVAAHAASATCGSLEINSRANRT